MDLSIIIPLYNEAESLPELKAWIDRSLQGFTYELIFVDDGSTDGSWEEISRLASLARNDRERGKRCPMGSGMTRNRTHFTRP